MANKFPGYCVSCSRRVGAGHGELTRSGSGAWVVDCGCARKSARRKSAPREPRKAGRCEKADGIVVGSSHRVGVRDALILVGEVFRAGKGWDSLSGQVVLVVGAETWYESEERNEDAGDMQGGGWGATRYVRLATEAEAAPLLAREAAAREAIEAPKRAAAARDAAASAQVTALPHVKPADLPDIGEVGADAYRLIRDQLVRGLGERTACSPAGAVRGRRIVHGGEHPHLALSLLLAASGEPIGLVEDMSSYDDCRTYYHVSPAAAVEARRASIADAAGRGHPITPRAAALNLARYAGCEGAEISRQVLSDAGVPTPPTVETVGLTCLAKDEEIEAALVAAEYVLPAVEVAEVAEGVGEEPRS